MEIVYKYPYFEDYFNVLNNEIEWKNYSAPRDESFMALSPLQYTYDTKDGGRTYTADKFNPLVLTIMERLNNDFNSQYDICFLNRYLDNKQHLGWHADDSREIDSNHPIAVVSFGAEREIFWKEQGYKGDVPTNQKKLLKSGSVFIMPAGFQEKYYHKIPKHSAVCGTRISLTYRKYKNV